MVSGFSSLHALLPLPQVSGKVAVFAALYSVLLCRVRAVLLVFKGSWLTCMSLLGRHKPNHVVPSTICSRRYIRQ